MQLSAISDNVSRPREVAKPANLVVSAKIEFIREINAEARKNQQFLVTAVTSWRNNTEN